MITRRALIGSAGIAAVAAPPAALSAMMQGGVDASPAPQEARLATTYIPTISHFDDRAARALRVGDRLVLRRDRNRTYDGGSVAVDTLQGSRLGYLPQIHSGLVAGMLDAGLGLTARVQSLSGEGSRLNVQIELGLRAA